MRHGGAGWYARGMRTARVLPPDPSPLRRSWSQKLAWPQPDRVLVEQLRLVHANAPYSFLSAAIVALLAAWVLAAAAGPVVIACWMAAVVGFGVLAVALARAFLRQTDPLPGSGDEASAVILLYALYGAVWGALPWLALDAAAPTDVALLIGCIAGMLAGGSSFMTPVRFVFAGYCVLLLLPLAIKLALTGETPYQALAGGVVIALAVSIAQANRVADSYRTMIELRFENVELVERLRLETESALAARADAEGANLAKSKFLAAASHDLRQPVHAQGLFLEVLARSTLTDEQRVVLTHARAAGTASGEMLNTLLDFSRIEAGVVKPQMAPFRLQPLLNEIEVELAALADAKGIVYRSRETHAVVASDAALVALILRNLVSNAIRYTEKGGVLVGCRTRGGAVEVEVWDTGIGIAPEHEQDVFREFHQLGNPERDRRKGLGLGLAIASGMAATLGHALVLRSRVGRGSVFRLALPLTDAPAVAEAATRSGDKVRLLGLRVLVIDDDETVRSGMQHLLRDWGAVCDAAESIDEALVMARAHAPALVISDYRLREQRTGAEAIAAVRSALGVDVPALLITGDTAPERLREAEASGVALLHKPVAPADLYRAVLTVLEQSAHAA